MRRKLRSNSCASLWWYLAMLALLPGLCVACTPRGSNRALEDLLNAKTPKEFSNQLITHGPIREEELAAIFEATSSRLAYRRHNAAKLLRTTIKGNAVELKRRAVLETSDEEVWAIILDDLMKDDETMAGKRPEMIKAALESKDPYTLGVGLRAGALSNYPGVRELARKYLEHPDRKVRAAAVSGLMPDDVRELLPRLTEMISKEKDEDTFISLAKSLIRTNDTSATAIVIKAIENLKETRDTLWLHFFNHLVFTTPDPMIDKFLFALAHSSSLMREEGFSALSRQVWANHREPSFALVKMCVEEIKNGDLSTEMRPQAKRRLPALAFDEQDHCEMLLSFMNDGKDPVHDSKGRRLRGKDAVAFAEQWLKDHGAS